MGLSVSFASILALLLGLGMFSFQAKAETTRNAEELTARVHRNNAGWDYIPKCSSSTYWSTKHNECREGKTKSDSYGLENMDELMAKVVKVDAGWNWEPRCADGTRWDSSDKRCERKK